MHEFIAKTKFPVLTFLMAFGVLFFFYHTVLLAPNDFLFSAHGDGIKNYYTYLYHAAYGDSFHHFSGMNYPFYEHIVYTDAHPLLSWTIGKLGLEAYGIGILNFFMLISYPIGALFLYKILNHYKVPRTWAVLGAVVIAFMTPQVFRMTGHFSMSYVFAVPLMWWLLIKAYSTKKWVWSGAIGLYLTAFFFTHPYLGIILAFFSIVFWMVNVIVDRKRFWRAAISVAIQVILPLVIFQGYVSLTDTHVDRLSNPAGFFHYYASWKSLLVAHDGPLRELYIRLKVNIGNWESWAYIGFSTIVFILIIIGYGIKKRKSIQWKSFIRKELVLFVIAAYLILLFAFCFPLKYDWLRWVTDLFGPLKQFRILGRFTWIFFYVAMVASIVGLHHIYVQQKHRVFQIIFFAGIIFYGFEFYPAHKTVAHHVSLASNAFKKENVAPDLKEVIDLANEGDYDAIIFLPFQHMSSENLMLLGAEQANYDAFLLSYYTQLPLMNSISSRMSLTEAIKVNNYFSPGFMEKELTYDIPKEDRILLVKNRDLLEINELRMIWESPQIFENETFKVFDFDQQKWNSRERFDKIVQKEKEALTKLENGWRSDTSHVWFYYNGFDTVGTDLPVEQRFDGTGAYMDTKSSWNTILTMDPSQIKPGDYVIRYWYYLRVDRPDVLAVVEQQFSEDKGAEWTAQFEVNQSTCVVQDWCLVEMEFSVDPDMSELNFLITGNGSGEPFVIDELLIQKQNDPALFRRTTKANIPYLIYNNYWLRTNSFE